MNSTLLFTEHERDASHLTCSILAVMKIMVISLLTFAAQCDFLMNDELIMHTT